MQGENQAMLDRKSHVSTIFGALISAVLIVTLLAACGGQSASQSSQPAASTKASEASKSQESTKPSGAAPAATKEALKIGVLLTMTGPQGAIGVYQQTGLQMAIEEINAAGGIMGRQVELIERDDGGDPTKTLTMAHELVEKSGVTLIFGTSSSSQALAAMPYLTEQKVFNIGSFSADAANDPQKYPYGFTGAPVSSVQAAVVAKYPIDVLKLKKIGLLVDAGAYGNSMLPPYTKEIQARGLTPVAVERYPYGSSADMSPQLNNLKKAGAEAIVSSSIGADSIRILKNLQSMGWSVPYSGVDLNSGAVVNGAGPEAMKMAYSYSQKNLTYSDKVPVPAKTKEFAAKLAKRMNQIPLHDSITLQSQFYDFGYLVKWAVETAQSTEGPKVAAALETLKGFNGAHASFTFAKGNHSGLALDELVMVKAASLNNGVFELAPGY